MKWWPDWVYKEPELLEWLETGLDRYERILRALLSCDRKAERSLVRRSKPFFFSKEDEKKLAEHFADEEMLESGRFPDPYGTIEYIELCVESFLDAYDPRNESRKWQRRMMRLYDIVSGQLEDYKIPDAPKHPRGEAMTRHLMLNLLKIVRIYNSPALRGRRPNLARDQLIRDIYDMYGEPPLTRDGHFEQTVELVLQFIGQACADIHKVVLTAIKRDPDPTRNA